MIYSLFLVKKLWKCHQFIYFIYGSNLIKMTSFLNKSKLFQPIVASGLWKYLVTTISFVASRQRQAQFGLGMSHGRFSLSSGFESCWENSLIIISVGTSLGHLFHFLNKVAEVIKNIAMWYTESCQKGCSKLLKCLLSLLHMHRRLALWNRWGFNVRNRCSVWNCYSDTFAFFPPQELLLIANPTKIA